MKTLLLPMLLLCLHGTFAQCKVESDKIDEFTGKRTVILKGGYLGDMVQLLLRTDSSYYLYISPVGDRIGCAKTGESKVMFKFHDGSIVEFIHLGKLNCKGSFVIRLNDYMDELLRNQITTIRLVGTGGTHTSELKKDRDLISRGLACLSAM